MAGTALYQQLTRPSSDGVSTFHEPYFIAAIKFMESTPSESTEYVLYYMVRLRRSVPSMVRRYFYYKLVAVFALVQLLKVQRKACHTDFV